MTAIHCDGGSRFSGSLGDKGHGAFGELVAVMVEPGRQQQLGGEKDGEAKG